MHHTTILIGTFLYDSVNLQVQIYDLIEARGCLDIFKQEIKEHSPPLFEASA